MPTPDTNANTLATAREHARAGRLAEAERVCREAMRAGPTADGHALLGLILARAGRLEEGLGHLEDAARLAPEDWRHQAQLGQASLAAGRADRAAAAFARAAVLRPDSAEAHLALGNARRFEGRLDEAIRAYRQAVALDASAAPGWINLGSSLIAAGEAGEAERALRRALTLAPQAHEAHYNLGLALSGLKRPKEAADAYRAALAIEPKAVAARLNLGAVLQAMGEHAGAAAEYARVIAADPSIAQAHANMAAALSELGQGPAALDAIRRAVALDPEDAGMRTTLAQMLREAGDLAGAERAFRAALGCRPGHVAALAQYSIVLRELGRREDAAALLDSSLVVARRIAAIPGWPSVAAFNAELAAYIRRHPTLLRDPANRATKIGSQTGEILNADDPPIAALRRTFETEVAAYLAGPLARPSSALRIAPPAAWRLHGWGVILRERGHQSPHYHPAGIASAVYYVRVPPSIGAPGSGEAGYIRFGHPAGATVGAADGLALSIRPEEGTLVLFPSDFWHDTVPLQGEEERISLAFDVLPA